MANLKDIAQAKGIEIKEKPTSVAPTQFQKRRTWTQNEEEKQSPNNDSIIRQPLDNTNISNSKPIENELKNISQAVFKDIPTKRPAFGKEIEKQSPNNDSIIRQSLDINHLVGKEKTLLCYIVSLCKNRASLETETVPSDELKNLLEVDNNGLANIVFRVKDKGFLSITEQKKGRVSWRKFSVPKEIYEQILRKGLENDIVINRNTYQKPLDNPLENPSYSSSSLNISKNYNHIEIPENVSDIGFGGRHISQILEMNKLNEIELQDSLYHFSEDLKTGLKTRVKTSPLALLIGILRNGSPYISEGFLTSLKADLDKVRGRVQQYEAIQKELQESALKAKFIEWKEKNPEEVQRISEEIKTSSKVMGDSPRFLEMMIYQKWEEITKEPEQSL